MLYHPKTMQSCETSCCPFGTHPEIAACYAAKCAYVCPKHCPPDAWLNGGAVGYAKVKILPDQHTRIPLLTIKVVKDKQEVTIAALCRTCAETYDSFIDPPKCAHTEEERMIEGCWLMHEVSFAIKRQNYKLIHVYSAVYFQETRDDVLLDLMTVLSKTKIANSGIPTDEDAYEYVAQLNRDSGFDMKVEDFKAPSLAMRNVSKLLMVRGALCMYT
jgi:hypothetical protein